MPLARNANLSAHFLAWELGADKPGIPGFAVSNLARVADWLEAARAAIGAPLVVNTATMTRRGWRSESENVAVGGSPTSDHVNGLAADFSAPSINRVTAWTRLRRASLPSFDQVIFYPWDGHFHVGLGPRMRRQWLVALREGGYQRAPSPVSPVVFVALGVLLFFLVVRK